MKTYRDRWMTNRYPLIEAGMSRRDCLDWWEARHDMPLERSACGACPFQSRQRWWPEMFAEPVEIDARLRDGLALDKTPSSTCCGCPRQRRSPWTRRSRELTDKGTGSATSARDTVGCEWDGVLDGIDALMKLGYDDVS